MIRHGSGLKYELIGNYIYYRTNYLLYNNLQVVQDENNMTTQTFEQWVKATGKTIDFTSWTHEDKLELYFGALDAKMARSGSY